MDTTNGNVFLDVRHVTAKLVPTYVCACGVRAKGDTIKVELVTSSDPAPIGLLVEASARMSLSAHMPVGWASYYAPTGTVFRCPNCTHGPQPEGNWFTHGA